MSREIPYIVCEHAQCARGSQKLVMPLKEVEELLKCTKRDGKKLQQIGKWNSIWDGSLIFPHRRCRVEAERGVIIVIWTKCFFETSLKS